jgi:hypothetical protein
MSEAIRWLRGWFSGGPHLVDDVAVLNARVARLEATLFELLPNANGRTLADVDSAMTRARRVLGALPPTSGKR